MNDLRSCAVVVALFAAAGCGYAIANLEPRIYGPPPMSATDGIRAILMRERLDLHGRGEKFETWLRAHPDLGCGYVVPKGAHFFDRSIRGKPPWEWGQTVRLFRIGTEFLGAMWFGSDGKPWTDDDEFVIVPARR